MLSYSSHRPDGCYEVRVPVLPACYPPRVQHLGAAILPLAAAIGGEWGRSAAGPDVPPAILSTRPHGIAPLLKPLPW